MIVQGRPEEKARPYELMAKPAALLGSRSSPITHRKVGGRELVESEFTTGYIDKPTEDVSQSMIRDIHRGSGVIARANT